jgi:hypothetical protein
MKIHCTAQFEGQLFNYHDAFDAGVVEADFQNEQIRTNITNLAIQKIKYKCDNYFNIDFNKMISFEVYYYNQEKEIQIFKKVKQ